MDWQPPKLDAPRLRHIRSSLVSLENDVTIMFSQIRTQIDRLLAAAPPDLSPPIGLTQPEDKRDG